ncbi:hypothetical protein N7445_001084 [Penicillium cf. griseofulvum]|nr:hypothetical protein N7445_001084 [Penicillium cf. griseofulvum]
MSDADPEREDHPEGASEESKAINFKWTPELVKIGTSRGAIHPSLGPIEEHNGFRIFKYRPGMTLPDPADTRECLRWAGLSDKKIIEVEQKFNQLYPDYQGLSCGYAEKYHQTGYTEIIFPKVEKMLDMFIQGMHDDHDEVEETHQAFIEKGIQLGLRLEFAIFCGLHKDDPRAIENPYLFEKDWFWMGPASIMTDTLISFWRGVEKCMVSKLLYDGKAFTCDGTWVVREGETIDQAKARVDDRERERLREQAEKEYKAEREREKDGLEKLCAEEDAIWAEQYRQAEMLKQQSIDKAARQKDGEGTQ